MSVPALAVANAFIRTAHERSEACSNMKLQKLIYFAHGLHLALGKGPLINDAFEAWKYGPVVPDLYHKFKGYFAGPIPLDHAYHDRGGALSEFEQALIKKTYDLFGRLSAVRLSEISHEQNSPWAEAYSRGSASAVIRNDRIEPYFRQKYVRAPVPH